MERNLSCAAACSHYPACGPCHLFIVLEAVRLWNCTLMIHIAADCLFHNPCNQRRCYSNLSMAAWIILVQTEAHRQTNRLKSLMTLCLVGGSGSHVISCYLAVCLQTCKFSFYFWCTAVKNKVFYLVFLIFYVHVLYIIVLSVWPVVCQEVVIGVKLTVILILWFPGVAKK